MESCRSEVILDRKKMTSSMTSLFGRIIVTLLFLFLINAEGQLPLKWKQMETIRIDIFGIF